MARNTQPAYWEKGEWCGGGVLPKTFLISLKMKISYHICFSDGLVMDKVLHIQSWISIQADASVHTATVHDTKPAANEEMLSDPVRPTGWLTQHGINSRETLTCCKPLCFISSSNSRFLSCVSKCAVIWINAFLTACVFTLSSSL